MKEQAISEMIGVLALIAVFVVLAAVVLSNLVSFYPPDVLPDPRIEIYNETYTNSPLNTIYITSTGGDPLPNDQYFVKVHTKKGEYEEIEKVNLTSVSNSGLDISTGNKLFFYDPDYEVDTVDIIYHDPASGSDTLIYRKGMAKPVGSVSEKIYYVRIMVTSSSTYPTSPTVTAGGQVVSPGPYVDIPVTSGQLALLAEGAVINNIWVASGQLSDPDDVKSSGSLVDNPGGKISYGYTQTVNNDLTILVDFRDPTIRIFNTGGDGVVTVEADTLLPDPGGSGVDFSRNIDAILQMLFEGVNGGIINDLKVIRGLANSGDDVLASSNQISSAVGESQFLYGLYNETNEYSFVNRASGDESHDFSVAVKFSGSEPTRTVRVINLGPGGIVRYESETVLSGVTKNLVVPQSGVNDLLIQGQTDFPIQKFTYISGIYSDATSVWSNPSNVNVSSAEGLESYTWSIPADSSDYTVVTQFLSSTYKTVRIINQGPDGIVLGNGQTINPGEVGEVFVSDGDSFEMNVTSQNGRVINSIAYTSYLTNDPDVVLNTGTTLGDASGVDEYNYRIDEVHNDYTFVVNFTTPQYTIRVFNDGGGIVNVSGTIINPGEFMDFSFNAGDDFSGLFDGQGLATIGELNQMSGIAADAATVFGTGTSISGAVGQGTYTHTISDITSSYSIAVRFNPILYSVEASACVGGTIEKEGTTIYLPGDTPTYNITATGLNRSYQLLIDGQSVNFPSGSREYMYQFEALESNHTIQVIFAINGAKGNYWGNAYINVFDPTPGYADITRTVRSGSRSGVPIEDTAYWNTQIHPYINLADRKAMADHSGGSTGARPYYTTLEAAWPNGVSPTVGQGTDKELFYVNWSGLMFLEDAGSYTFWTRCDDGMKLFIDGNMITSDARAWVKPNPPTYADHYPCTTNPSTVLPGWHSYYIWMYDNYVHAVADLRYQEPGETAVSPATDQSIPFFRDLYYLPTSCDEV